MLKCLQDMGATTPYKFKYDKILQLNLSTKVFNENRNQNSIF